MKRVPSRGSKQLRLVPRGAPLRVKKVGKHEGKLGVVVGAVGKVLTFDAHRVCLVIEGRDVWLRWEHVEVAS